MNLPSEVTQLVAIGVIPTSLYTSSASCSRLTVCSDVFLTVLHAREACTFRISVTLSQDSMSWHPCFQAALFQGHHRWYQSTLRPDNFNEHSLKLACYNASGGGGAPSMGVPGCVVTPAPQFSITEHHSSHRIYHAPSEWTVSYRNKVLRVRRHSP